MHSYPTGCYNTIDTTVGGNRKIRSSVYFRTFLHIFAYNIMELVNKKKLEKLKRKRIGNKRLTAAIDQLINDIE